MTHIYFNGDCKQAISLYEKAFGVSVQTLIEHSDQPLVVHAEILIHNEVLMVNDFGNNDGHSTSGGYQLSLQFDDEAALKKAYAEMQKGSTTIEPMQPTDFSPCTVRFIDRFGVRWAFWV